MGISSSYDCSLFPYIDPNVMEDLAIGVTTQEVYDSLFDMASLKAPGIDGLHAQFYQS